MLPTPLSSFAASTGLAIVFSMRLVHETTEACILGLDCQITTWHLCCSHGA
ncbi:unnamed protein product, partial [Heterosigma akashiwo]